MTRHLARMSWPQVAEAMARRPVVLIPMGALEPHGPHLPMGLDFLLAEHVADAASARAEALVAPTLSHGYCSSSADFPGAVTLRPQTLMDLAEDVLRSLVRHGFTHMLFLDNHRSNTPYVEAAARTVRAESGALIGSFFPWGTIINCAPSHYDAFSAAFGHGAEPETSTALFLCPEWVEMTRARADAYAPFHGTRMRSAGEPVLGRAAASIWINSSEISQTGTSGDPTIGDPVRGRRLVEAAVEELIGVIEAFRRIPAGVGV